jgi:Uma2 family endonuclease
MSDRRGRLREEVNAMSTSVHDYGPWTEEAYFAWDDDISKKAELFDGVLVVPPQPDIEHQHMSFLLTTALEAAARPGRLRALQDINVRLAPRRIVVPDVSLIPRGRLAGGVVEASSVWFVVEIVSPGNARTSSSCGPGRYAEAGIPSYLMVERRPELALHLYLLDVFIAVE